MLMDEKVKSSDFEKKRHLMTLNSVPLKDDFRLTSSHAG